MKTTKIIQDIKLVPVVRKARLKDINESKEDLIYWLTRPVTERISAVTFLISQSLNRGERMDKSIVNKIKLKDK